MFFDNIELAKASRTQLAELPRAPETGWRAPTSYPNISQAIAIGFDFEVKENEFDRGPGWSRGKASIVGGSLDIVYRDSSTYTEYRPIRHEVDRHLNLPVENTVQFWKDALQTPVPKFGANITYDIGNGTDEKIWVQGELHDCQYAEALLTQDDLVGLEHVSAKYLKQHKQSNQLYQWCADAYGGKPTASQRKNIYRTSPKLAGPYGEQDARLPRLNLIHQVKLLQQQGLYDLYRMECDLIRLWITMRKIGVRVDLDKAEQMYGRLSKEIKILEQKLYELTGKWINVDAPTELAPVYDTLGIKYLWSPGKCEAHHAHKEECGGQPSFTAPWFAEQTDDVSLLVLETRRLYKLKDTFIGSYILKSHVNGIVHGQFHPLRNEGSRGEQGGTVTGRLSSSTPDLQNIPSRTALGKQVEEVFLPDEGHLCVESGDYSQIEYRMFMHFAIGPKSDEFRQRYIDNPHTDYHKLTQKTLNDASGIYIPRNAEEVLKQAWRTGRLTIKELNFGLLFGLGLKKMCAMARCNLTEGGKAREAYFQAMPFIKPSQKAFIEEAKRNGFITTVLNRRYRFDLWEEVSEWDEETQSYSRSEPLSYEMAIRKYGAVQRAGTHRSMAGRCQGSAADVLKYSFWRCLKDGLFDVMGYPKLSVHDQSLRSVIDDSPQQKEAGRHYHWTMENALKLRVPIVFELARGPNWGKVVKL